MTNEQVNLTPWDKLQLAVQALVKVLLLQKEARWASSDQEELVGAEVGAAWETVENLLGEVASLNEAATVARTIQQVSWYLENIKLVRLDEYDQSQLREIMDTDSPSWYHPD